jgi:hypothetical protein
MKFEEILPDVRKGRRFRMNCPDVPAGPWRDLKQLRDNIVSSKVLVLCSCWELESNPPKRLSEVWDHLDKGAGLIRRRAWETDRYMNSYDPVGYLSAEDLEADDWEIVE